MCRDVSGGGTGRAGGLQAEPGDADQAKQRPALDLVRLHSEDVRGNRRVNGHNDDLGGGAAQAELAGQHHPECGRSNGASAADRTDRVRQAAAARRT